MILPLPHKYSIFVQFLSQCTFVPSIRCTGRRCCALGLIEYFNIVEKLFWLTLHFTAVSTEFPLVSASCTPFIFPSPPHPVSKSGKVRDSIHSTLIWADVKKVESLFWMSLNGLSLCTGCPTKKCLQYYLNNISEYKHARSFIWKWDL